MRTCVRTPDSSNDRRSEISTTSGITGSSYQQKARGFLNFHDDANGVPIHSMRWASLTDSEALKLGL